MNLVFATNNPNKVKEISALLPQNICLTSLQDIGCNEDIPETQNTIAGNALQKARYIYKKYNTNCFADDTGLEVEALHGAPGVLSARYAGEQKNSADNIKKLLHDMETKGNRNAQFKTVIALIIGGAEHLFEGIVTGHILNTPSGNKGFGYDPVFVPFINKQLHHQTFAEMSMEEKNNISHRGIAVKKLVAFLNEYKI